MATIIEFKPQITKVHTGLIYVTASVHYQGHHIIVACYSTQSGIRWTAHLTIQKKRGFVHLSLKKDDVIQAATCQKL